MKRTTKLLLMTKFFLALSSGAVMAKEIDLNAPNHGTHKVVLEVSDEELYCLTQNIYFESRGEPVEGQIAVAHVTLNRMRHDKFPNTICGVVWQRKQFSWTHDGLSDRPRNKEAWQNAEEIAKNILSGEIEDNTNGSLFFHSVNVKPYWRNKVNFEVQIGRHLYYKWSGKW